ncbi:hypothetical protein KIF59_09990 [Enterobacter cloacae subsp. cloacae]|nr:hypothetical protein [Enterobacter cloacae subsp. cloacae]
MSLILGMRAEHSAIDAILFAKTRNYWFYIPVPPAAGLLDSDPKPWALFFSMIVAAIVAFLCVNRNKTQSY